MYFNRGFSLMSRLTRPPHMQERLRWHMQFPDQVSCAVMNYGKRMTAVNLGMIDYEYRKYARHKINRQLFNKHCALNRRRYSPICENTAPRDGWYWVCIWTLARDLGNIGITRSPLGVAGRFQSIFRPHLHLSLYSFIITTPESDSKASSRSINVPILDLWKLELPH